MKKQIPINIRKTLEHLVSQNSNLIYAEINEDSVVVFKDKDVDSDFYFAIEKIVVQSNGKTTYKLNYKPYSRDNLQHLIIDQRSLEDLKTRATTWIGLLHEFNKDSILFDDDPISKAYYEELEPLFEIIDDDAEVKPFEYNQQKALVDNYDDIIELILNDTNDENKNESDQLIQEIEQSKKLITKSTKKQVIDRLQKNFVKIRKFSIKIFEKTIVKYLSDIGKKLISGEIDLTNYLQ